MTPFAFTSTIQILGSITIKVGQIESNVQVFSDSDDDVASNIKLGETSSSPFKQPGSIGFVWLLPVHYFGESLFNFLGHTSIHLDFRKICSILDAIRKTSLRNGSWFELPGIDYDSF